MVATLPDPHLLQTWQWSQVKAAYGWEPHPMVWIENGRALSAAMILKKRLPVRGFAARMGLVYVPKGPLMDWGSATLRTRVLDDLQEFARGHGAVFLKIDPDVPLGWSIPEGRDEPVLPIGGVLQTDLQGRGWRFSPDQVQFRNTVLLDLSGTEEELLARMKQKTRYNIRLAARKGVTVRVGLEEDLSLLYDMYAETAARDGFVIREEAYYRKVWQTFMRSKSPGCDPLIAEVEGAPVAAIFVFSFAGRAYYLYGMSRVAHREKMPNYRLQWEAMLRAKAAGILVYDLWGAPDTFDESDPMWGVYRFKDGLGGRVLRTLGAWDFTPRPILYRLYTGFIPHVLDLMRAQGMARTRRNVGA